MTRHDHIAGLLDRIDACSRAHPVVAVLRHSVRGEIPDMRKSFEVPLTDEGRTLAIEFGARLPRDRLVRLFHSPIPRCLETAELIGRGFTGGGGAAECLGSRDFLVGFYLHDPGEGLARMEALGLEGFMREWFKGTIDEKVIKPAPEAADELLRRILDCRLPAAAAARGVIDIHVTHDVNIVLLMDRLYDVARSPYPWPGYLEGILIRPAAPPPGFVLSFRDREATIVPAPALDA